MRNSYFDRKRIKGIESYIQGVQNYLQIANEGEAKSEMLDKIVV
jgi:hypothetical protein